MMMTVERMRVMVKMVMMRRVVRKISSSLMTSLGWPLPVSRPPALVPGAGVPVATGRFPAQSELGGSGPAVLPDDPHQHLILAPPHPSARQWSF
jgi:hypothetical protein